MNTKFTLTFDVVTEHSALNGETARSGFIPRSGRIPTKSNLPSRHATFGLRQAVNFLLDRESYGPVEADCSLAPRSFSYGGNYSIKDWGYVTVTLHLPRSVSQASAIRIGRLLKCHGI